MSRETLWLSGSSVRSTVSVWGRGGTRPPTQLCPGGKAQGPGWASPCLGPGPDSTGENKGLFHSLSVERLPILGLTAGLVLKPDYPLGLGLSPA